MYKNIFVICIGYILLGINAILCIFSYKSKFNEFVIFVLSFLVFSYTLYYFIVFPPYNIDNDAVGFDSIISAPTVNFIANLIFPIFIMYLLIIRITFRKL